ncbi:Ig-like domain-containing protein [Paenibacillus athensensis]|nr:Ig-like domain-containing protein [Paenibacillus athensensis]MCD1260630.1 Ig-like domain-containing protein [Paenibacillus athensensis]
MKKIGSNRLLPASKTIALVAGSLLLLSSQSAAMVFNYDRNLDGSIHIDDAVMYMNQAEPADLTGDSVFNQQDVLHYLNQIQPLYVAPEGATAQVSNEAELRAALADSSYTTIRLLNNIQVSGDLMIGRSVDLTAINEVVLQADTFMASVSFSLQRVTLQVDVGSSGLALKKAMMSPAQSILVNGVDGFSGRLHTVYNASGVYYSDDSGIHAFALSGEGLQLALDNADIQHIHLVDYVYASTALVFPSRQLTVSSQTPVIIYAPSATGIGNKLTLTNVSINNALGNATVYINNPGNGGETGTHPLITGTAVDPDSASGVQSVTLRIRDSAGNYVNAEGESVDATPIDLTAVGTTNWSLQIGTHGLAPGAYTLQAFANDGLPGTASTSSFTAVALNMVFVSTNSLDYVMTGDTLKFYGGYSPYNANANFEWSVSDDTYAQIDSSGLLTGLQAGSVIVRATDTYTGIQGAKLTHVYDSAIWSQITAAAQAATEDNWEPWEALDLDMFIQAGFVDLDEDIMPPWLLSEAEDTLTMLYSRFQPLNKWTPRVVQGLFESYARDLYLDPSPTDSFTLQYDSPIFSGNASKEAFHVYKISDGILSEVPLASVQWIEENSHYKLEFRVEDGASISAFDTVIVQYDADSAQYPLLQQGDPGLIRMPSFIMTSSFMPPM